MNLPFATVQDHETLAHVLLGEEDGVLVGFDPVSLELLEFEPDAIVSTVSLDPVAVYFGVEAQWAVEEQTRMAANAPRRGQVPRLVPRGDRFPLLPKGVLSGYPTAAKVIRQFRENPPSVDSVRVSALFAVSTVRTSIEEAEESFLCFADLYAQHERQMPSTREIRACFRGLYDQKSEMFARVGEYAPVIQRAIQSGMKDLELRRFLALETDLPAGLGLAKLSFTLALLGHDLICLDGRLLGTMFPDPDRREQIERSYGKKQGALSELALQRYEGLESAFLRGNKHYNARDPLGRARAQWLAWEAVGGAGASHSVWLDVVKAGMHENPAHNEPTSPIWPDATEDERVAWLVRAKADAVAVGMEFGKVAWLYRHMFGEYPPARVAKLASRARRQRESETP